MGHLEWDGCWNARDLGGLGGVVRPGALIRADAPNRLSGEGWDALVAHGVRTIVDLRDPVELDVEYRTHDGLDVVRLPLEDQSDDAFWTEWRDSGLWATPLYYRAFLERYPDRCAEAVRAVTDAPPGGVLVACGRGRDRTGLVVTLVLAAAGVPPDAIAADYVLSASRLAPYFASRGEEDEALAVDELLQQHGTTAEAAIVELLTAVDVVQALRDGGLTDGELDRLRRRLVDPA